MMVIGGSGMTVDALVARIARLEGADEQIDKRLGSLENRMTSLEHAVHEGFAQVRHELSAIFRWVIGTILVNRITVMLAVVLRR